MLIAVIVVVVVVAVVAVSLAGVAVDRKRAAGPDPVFGDITVEAEERPTDA